MCYQHAIQARPSFAMAFGEFILIKFSCSSNCLKSFFITEI